jgi:sec-independent protein translocase protein TatA
MGNFSMWEILLILVVVLLLFGAKRIPEIAGSFGKGIREFKKSMTDVERSITEPERPAHRLPPEQPRDTVHQADEQQPEPRRLI